MHCRLHATEATQIAIKNGEHSPFEEHEVIAILVNVVLVVHLHFIVHRKDVVVSNLVVQAGRVEVYATQLR